MCTQLYLCMSANVQDSLPPKIRKRYVSPPTSRSLHNYGAAVDITLVNENGVPLDMGAQYDEFNKIAYPRLEQYFLKNGKLTSKKTIIISILPPVKPGMSHQDLSLIHI